MKNICDWNNCNEIGEYKAPVEKDNSKKISYAMSRTCKKNLIKIGIISQA
jgi:hypothetical protein